MFTLKSKQTISGEGIHSGNPVSMEIEPYNQPGIYFEYDNQIIQATVSSIGLTQLRSTSITNGVISIQTVEHFLSACYALELTNIKVKLSANELPILDGSAIQFVDNLRPNLTSLSHQQEINMMSIEQDVNFEFKGSHYFIFPSNSLSITAFISYPNDWVKSQTVTYKHSLENYIQFIAAARTYGFEHELEYLRNNNLAKGGNLDNALVITKRGYMNEPRFENEMVKHKILDFIGDMSLLNQRLMGNFVLIKPSHQANCELLKIFC